MTVDIRLNDHILSMEKTPLHLTVKLDGKQIGKTDGRELKFKLPGGKILVVSAEWKSVFPHYTVTLDGIVIYDK